MKIYKCVCNNVTFEEIACIAKQHNVYSIKDLQKYVSVCNSCYMCQPYIKITIETGKTEFNEPIT